VIERREIWAMPDPFGLQTPERRDTRSREELVHRVRREFDGLPGLTLTLDQAARVFYLDRPRCERLLGELVQSGELTRMDDQRFKRPGGE
jgi:hypothetical protein